MQHVITKSSDADVIKIQFAIQQWSVLMHIPSNYANHFYLSKWPGQCNENVSTNRILPLADSMKHPDCTMYSY